VDIDLELYRGEDLDYYGDMELNDVLRKAALRHFGNPAKRGQIQMQLEGPRDPDPYPGPPEVRNIAKLGHCVVRLTRGGETVLEERLRIAEFLGPVLADELRDLTPAEARWSFLLKRRRFAAFIVTGISGIADHFSADERPEPEIEGAVEVDIREPRHRPFTLTQVPAADAELVQPEALGLDRSRLGKLNILMSAGIRDQFLHTMELSSKIEEGGFLLGRVTRADDDTHLVEVTHVTPAHHSGAGVVHFTFTGESFLAVAQLIEERNRGEELVGWYHTHVYSIVTSMGLSSIDVDLHLATFQRPWQVAALINLRKGDRLLRFYGRGGPDGLTEYNQWICDDSGRYRPADHAVGDDAKLDENREREQDASG
jgi:proteasome lid subunit RPN8/RPN11